METDELHYIGQLTLAEHGIKYHEDIVSHESEFNKMNNLSVVTYYVGSYYANYIRIVINKFGIVEDIFIQLDDNYNSRGGKEEWDVAIRKWNELIKVHEVKEKLNVFVSK